MEDRLSRRERQIMDVLFERGEATAGEIHEQLPDAPSYTAVRTLLKILGDKGWVRHWDDGRRFVYAPTRSSEAIGRSALQRVIRVFFSSSLENALAAHLSDPDSQPDEDELQRLRQLIDEASKSTPRERKSTKRRRKG